MQRISDVKNTIAQLYSLLNVEEHQLNRERDLVATLEKLKADLEPLEKVCNFIFYNFDQGSPQSSLFYKNIGLLVTL